MIGKWLENNLSVRSGLPTACCFTDTQTQMLLADIVHWTVVSMISTFFNCMIKCIFGKNKLTNKCKHICYFFMYQNETCRKWLLFNIALFRINGALLWCNITEFIFPFFYIFSLFIYFLPLFKWNKCTASSIWRPNLT